MKMIYFKTKLVAPHTVQVVAKTLSYSEYLSWTDCIAFAVPKGVRYDRFIIKQGYKIAK